VRRAVKLYSIIGSTPVKTFKQSFSEVCFDRLFLVIRQDDGNLMRENETTSIESPRVNK